MPKTSNLDDDLVRNIRILCSLRGETLRSISLALGRSHAYLYGRMNRRTSWSLAELEEIAAHFDVDPIRLLTARSDIFDLASPGRFQ
jgi:hypothetical protein